MSNTEFWPYSINILTLTKRFLVLVPTGRSLVSALTKQF